MLCIDLLFLKSLFLTKQRNILCVYIFYHWQILLCILKCVNKDIIIIDPLLACIFYFILFSNVFCILVHDYTLCFIGSPCCSVSYYNYISVSPYYIVIQKERRHLHNWDTDHCQRKIYRSFKSSWFWTEEIRDPPSLNLDWSGAEISKQGNKYRSPDSTSCPTWYAT